MKKSIFFRVGVIVLMLGLISCEKVDLVSELDQNKSDNSETTLKAASISYNIKISGPTAVLIKGNSTEITGVIKDNYGKVVANQTIGVENGLGLYCNTTKTDKYGNIKYSTKVNVSGVAVVTFIVNNQRTSFIFQTAYKKSGSTYYSTAVNVNTLKLKNNTGKDLRLKTKIDNGPSYSQKLVKNATQTMFTSPKTKKNNRATVFGGYTFIVGVGGGADGSITVDSNGVGQLSVSAGLAFLRGAGYVTNYKDWGLCWAPGADYGVSPYAVKAEATLCVGTDGINYGGSAGIGNYVGGINTNIYQW